MIKIENLNVKAGNFALRDINLDIGENEFFILMGPTGAGKTLLLETIAGLNPCINGKIFLDDQEITKLSPEKRGIGIVYQDCALFPHLDVEKNITYGLRYNGISKGEGEQRLELLVKELNLGHILKRLPVNLSGGEKQRVALARALMVKPTLMLLDEPFSNLDPGFREEVKVMIRNIHKTSKTTFIMVTHDFTDARELGESGAVLNNGIIEQIGRLDELFTKPVNEFVKRFVG
jgi:molybdate/tungstate transport system ATP-binding protein